jgi:hypothetical protein
MRIAIAIHGDAATQSLSERSGHQRAGACRTGFMSTRPKQALEAPTPQELKNFLDFSTSFRRLSIWNARMVYIQRPGARIVATEHEWRNENRLVKPDAAPIIILWPFSPIRFVYELEDTAPDIDREAIGDPLAVKGES